MMNQSGLPDFETHPLTRERWSDLEELFGKRGACAGCWCMFWRIKRSQFNQQKGDANRKALKEIADSGETPGILGYVGNVPIGWCSVAPRKSYLALENSRILRRIDDKPVWSIVCFFVAKQFRHKGVTLKLIKAAIDHVRRSGGNVIEGYPVEPRTAKAPDIFLYTGLASAFLKAGFTEVQRRSETRPIMRYVIERK